MRSIWLWCFVGTVAMLAAATSARADFNPDPYYYEVLIDTDNNTSTGCDVALHDANFNGTVSGVEYIVRALVLRFSANADVDEVTLRHCISGTTFTAPAIENSGNWAVGLNNGVPVPAPYNFADVVEFYVSLAHIGSPGTMRLAFHAKQKPSPLNDVLLTTNGDTTGSPIIFPPGQRAPALSNLALALCAVLLTAGAWWGLRRRSTLASALLAVAFLSSLAMTAWAVTIMLDGNVSDWTGVPRAGTDAVNDSSVGDPAEDIAAAFVTADAQNLYFRMDQVNLAPVVCGDGIIESGEYCEKDADCHAVCDTVDGATCASLPPPPACTCSNCMCVGCDAW